MKITNTTKNTVLSVECRCADTFRSRFAGLMLKSALLPGEGLLIKPCNSIHTCFMRFPLDIVFIGKDGLVLRTLEGIKPWRVSPVVPKAHSVLELPAGTIAASRTEKGDRLLIG